MKAKKHKKQRQLDFNVKAIKGGYIVSYHDDDEWVEQVFFTTEDAFNFVETELLKY